MSPSAPATGPWPKANSSENAAALDVLTCGEIDVHGRIAGSSNATLLVTVRADEQELLAVYKPESGERPLWDFPGGLFRREVAAFELSEQLGWGLVPTTIVRRDGPFGIGSLQRYVPEDGEAHYFTVRAEPEWEGWLITMAAFDIVANNADRKSGHVLLAEDRLWAIDNGLCFHDEPKLRTVIWDFAGEPLPEHLRSDLERFAASGFDGPSRRLLSDSEHGAMVDRARALVDDAILPAPDPDAYWPPYPWPLI